MNLASTRLLCCRKADSVSNCFLEAESPRSICCRHVQEATHVPSHLQSSLPAADLLPNGWAKLAADRAGCNHRHLFLLARLVEPHTKTPQGLLHQLGRSPEGINPGEPLLQGMPVLSSQLSKGRLKAGVSVRAGIGGRWSIMGAISIGRKRCWSNRSERRGTRRYSCWS